MRLHVRQWAQNVVRKQSVGVSRIQKLVGPAAVHASKQMGVLGTHAFFLAFLPPLFFAPSASAPIPSNDLQVSIVAVLALGVCLSSLIKDWVGAPRPLVTVGVARASGCATTEREFGLPSTHSTNAMSVACILLLHLPIAWYTPFLAAYPIVMGFSRIISGMHSWLDVWCGWALGGAVSVGWWYLWSVVGWHLWILESGPEGLIPVLCVIPLLLYLHPDPHEACPCFEDSVAFVSVFSGLIIGHWMRHGVYWNTNVRDHSDNPYYDPTSDQDQVNVVESRAWIYVDWTISLCTRIALGGLSIYIFRKCTKLLLGRLFKTTLSRPTHKPKDDDAKKMQPNHGIPRFTPKMVTDVVVYFGIAVLAVDSMPRLFEFLAI
ncbi:phosphatidic acid phosphatase type 2/haloperoxidase [Chytriomyces cf. hyalinus JEL632]|nr:phosphatidic acid phosphatase type 2/haloperoxidase [Chytriomyces cf. hyalinus JEL632]